VARRRPWREEAEEQEAVGRQAGQRQRGDGGAGAGTVCDVRPGGAGVADQLVAGIGDERRAGVETSATASLAMRAIKLGPDPVGIVIVIGRHRPLDADMGEELGGDPAVLDRDHVGPGEDVGGVRAQIGKIADRRRDDIEAGGKFSS
jgi:hypothetical protein